MNKKYSPIVFEPLHILRQHQELVHQTARAAVQYHGPGARQLAASATAQASFDDMLHVQHSLWSWTPSLKFQLRSY